MAMPSPPSRFPDDTGADLFVREFPMAVAPDDPAGLSTSPPLIVLSVPQPVTPADPANPAQEHRARVRRVLGALESSLQRDNGAKLAPYALVWAEDHPASASMAESAGNELGRGIPRHMTPDRFPDFVLLREVIAFMRERREWPAPVPRELRDHAYRQRVGRGGLPALLWSLSGGEAPPIAGLRGWLLGTWWRALTITFPRWYWARRQTARLIRPGTLSLNRRPRWLGSDLGRSGGREDLFEVLDAVAERQVPRLALPADHQRHIDALQHFERLLVRALLEDLRKPSPGRARPSSRRRTARPVLLVELPPEGSVGSGAAERLVRALHTASGTDDRADAAARSARRPGPLVIAVGSPSAALLRDLNAESGSLSLATERMRDSGDRPVLVTLNDEPFSRDGQSIRRVKPRVFKLRASTQTAGVTAFALLAVSALVYGGFRVVAPPVDVSCAGGDGAVAKPTERPELKPGALYNEAYDEIQSQNGTAEKFAAQGRTVRTVVYFGSDRPKDDTSTTILFDGTIPELRGVALWQRRLNQEAVSDDSRVPLRVDVRYTGAGFVNAEREARKLVAELEHKPRAAYEEIVGVLGFAQSKEESRKALTVLAQAEIPVVGTTATADEMLGSRSYWPLTPLNSTEARIAANFAATANIVARSGGQQGCAPARHAVVVHTSNDLYSKGLADDFRESFQGTEDIVDFSQTGASAAGLGIDQVSRPDDLAENVCRKLSQHQESIVYWTARARDFTAFVNAFDRQKTCAADGLTVLGGNELTNVAQTGEYDDNTWLRLYHSAHTLPVTDDRSSDSTKDFVQEYDSWVDGPPERDPWRYDGHSAVSYDAFRMLSQSVDRAAKWDLTPSGVRIVLGTGVTFEGATGSVLKPTEDNRPPADKTLAILRQSADGPVVLAACGAYRPGETYAKQAPPCSE
ncbi:ABC transporter substrate-binding protein [Streptomyces sp. NPDC051243]|uniref:ABC transporter substrate-binding protein n=1 Tax=Streptomyces sp. NPDC051243 TaxID=3365646 RepID=UPI00378E232E